MNPALLLALNPSSMKKVLALVIATLVVIVSLPIGVVFTLTNAPLMASLGSAGSNGTQGTAYDEPANPENRYDYGYCTYWTQERRIAIGKPIPNNWGDAISWNINALLAGYRVDHVPSVGSIFQWPAAPGGEGHVAFVERIDELTGAWTISEMNAVGWNVMDERTYPASDAQKYNFIHDKESQNGLTAPALLNAGM